jgi:hypothetical protein
MIFIFVPTVGCEVCTVRIENILSAQRHDGDELPPTFVRRRAHTGPAGGEP